MPSVASNTIYECNGCHSKFDFEKMPPAPLVCPHCGHERFTSIVVQEVCDFCSNVMEEGDVWTHPCKDFEYGIQVMGMPAGGSKGPWAACGVCHALVEAEDQKALSKRALEHDMRREPEMRAHEHSLYAINVRIHQGFFKNRIGSGYKGRPDEPEKGG